MSGSGDYQDEMPRNHPLDDVAIEAFFTGHEAGEELGPLAGFVEDLHSMASGPAPAPSLRLAAMLADGISADDALLAPAAGDVTGSAPQVAGSSWTRKRQLVVAQLVGLSVAAKAVLGISAAAAAVTAGGAAGVLPGPAQHAVSTGVEAVTPFSFPDRAGSKADFGGRVSADARDGGIDGPTVSAEAQLNGQANPPADTGRPAAPGQNGLDQANTTPAAGHVPTVVPGGQPSTAGTPSSTGRPTTGSTPAAGHLPTSSPADPPANTPPAKTPPASTPPATTPPAGAGTQSTAGAGTATSTPGSGHQPGSVRPADPGRP